MGCSQWGGGGGEEMETTCLATLYGGMQAARQRLGYRLFSTLTDVDVGGGEVGDACVAGVLRVVGLGGANHLLPDLHGVRVGGVVVSGCVQAGRRQEAGWQGRQAVEGHQNNTLALALTLDQMPSAPTSRSAVKRRPSWAMAVAVCRQASRGDEEDELLASPLQFPIPCP